MAKWRISTDRQRDRPEVTSPFDSSIRFLEPIWYTSAVGIFHLSFAVQSQHKKNCHIWLSNKKATNITHNNREKVIVIFYSTHEVTHITQIKKQKQNERKTVNDNWNFVADSGLYDTITVEMRSRNDKITRCLSRRWTLVEHVIGWRRMW